MSVDLPSSTLPHVMNRSRLFCSCACRYAWMSSAMRFDLCMLEVPFLLLLLHRCRTVVVDHTTLAFGARGEQHLLDDRGQGVGAALDRTGQGVAAERAETNPFHVRFLAGCE